MGTLRAFFSTFVLLAVTTTATAALGQGDEEDQKCLAEALYYEARDQGWRGMLAVGIVIQNRVTHRKYPDTICEVVKQGRYWNGNPIKWACQFSYFCDGKPERPAEKESWTTAQEIAQLLLMQRIEIAGLEDVTHYHATWVTPHWSKVFERRYRLGDHIFYVQR